MTTVVSQTFVDTNILIYATDTLSPWYDLARAGLDQAHRGGAELVLSPQVLREYLAATTRLSTTGQGAPLAQVLENIRVFRAQFRVVDETALVTDRLVSLLQTIQVAGKQIHDANIVATMLTYSIPYLLTHNVTDFTRFAHLITVLPLDASLSAGD